MSELLTQISRKISAQRENTGKIDPLDQIEFFAQTIKKLRGVEEQKIIQGTMSMDFLITASGVYASCLDVIQNSVSLERMHRIDLIQQPSKLASEDPSPDTKSSET